MSEDVQVINDVQVSEARVASEDAPKKIKRVTDDEMADLWIDRYPDTKFDLGNFRRYQLGHWPIVPREQIESEILDVMIDSKPRGARPTGHAIKSLMKIAEIKTHVPPGTWDASPSLIAFPNGTLDTDTMVLRPHSPDDYLTTTLAYPYDPDATCPHYEAAVNGRIPDAAQLWQEFAGYSFTPDTRYEIALWLFGERGSGKSTLLEGLQAALGSRCGSLSLRDIESRFAFSDIVGKTLLTATEGISYTASTHLINALISGENIKIERKFAHAYTARSVAKIAWAMNTLPRVNDSEDGLFRRVWPIEFPPASTIGEIDVNLKEKIKLEAPGIFNWAMRGLLRLRERGKFVIPASVRKSNDDFAFQNDVVRMFIVDQCEQDDNVWLPLDVLFNAYASWCLRSNYRALGKMKASAELRRLGLKQKRVSGGMMLGGYKLR